MAELLVKPYRDLDPERAGSIYGLLALYPHLEWIPPDLPIANTAAEIRAGRGLKIPDALQAATAVHAGATGLIANDQVFRRVPAFETLLFDELL
jgi:predicted nucleic acid-binding protein